MEGDVRGSTPQDRPSAPALHRPAAARIQADRNPGLTRLTDPGAAEAFEALLRRAREDPAIVGFWLGGSRGMGRPTAYSDYDCAVILDDAAPESARGEIEASRRPGLDLMVMSLSAFERYAAWGSAEAWYRYGCAHLTALVDKTGALQPMIDAKARVPAEAAGAFIAASLDHALNQAYRGLKCLRDGDLVASRLEAAESVAPFLDAAFALHGGRLRPYYKYLAWELASDPLARFGFDGEVLQQRLLSVLTDGPMALSWLLAQTRAAFGDAGHDGVFLGWDALDWILAGEPSEAWDSAGTV